MIHNHGPGGAPLPKSGIENAPIRLDGMQFDCPHCGACAGHACVSESGKRASTTHADRRRAATEALEFLRRERWRT